MSFASEHVIVTGGAGFIGSYLVKRLLAEGARVTVIDNLWRGALENLDGPDGKPVIDLEKDFHLGDLTDYGRCMEVLRDAHTVYHLADIVGGVHFAFQAEAFIFRHNVLINTNVLSACVANKVPNYIYVGTACSFPMELQMQPGIVALHEDQTYPAEPESSYGWSKLMGEYEAEIARKNGSIDVGLLRLHNVYGPGSSPEPSRSQVLPSLMRKAALHPEEPFTVWGTGEQYRDFVYVEDVVEALVLLAEKGMNQGVIQVGGEKATTIREAAELVIEISGKGIEPRFDTSMPQGDRGRIAICDRARSILGWTPKVDLRTGFERTYAWVHQKVRGDLDGVSV